MVRSSCCVKVGMKKGPWSPGEDEILISYIQKHGHTNWRALPKAAGLQRCGKSCRLRWTNYLRPDIKRGNFTPEEDQAIINYHGMLGNRWSAIAAKLPGRTDNEIKNVWNTRLKKTLLLRTPQQYSNSVSASPSSESSSCNDATFSIDGALQDESVESWDDGAAEEMIEESFWTETLFMNTDSTDQHYAPSIPDSNNDVVEGGMSFWYRILMQAGDLQGLPAI